MVPRIGIDFGRVLFEKHPLDIGISKDPEYLSRVMVSGALEALSKLQGLFGSEMFLVSKCSEAAEPRIIELLETRGITSYLHKERLHFCRGRADKAPICAKLGITHFVDDRSEVLSHMTTVPFRYVFRPHEEEFDRFGDKIHLHKVKNWPQAVALITTHL